MCDNVEDCCRICLDVGSVHIPILGDSMVNLHIKSCLAMSVTPNDNLPKTICESCVSKLSEFYHFQLNARCSLDWLESCMQEKTKKPEVKIPIQPLPDSEYNSDSLLEFLNNTANIEEYLTNLGKEDIPSIVSMLDKNIEGSVDTEFKVTNTVKVIKNHSPKKKDGSTKTKPCKIQMEIDVLDSDVDIVKEILMKETEPKSKSQSNLSHVCFACKSNFQSLQKLSLHLSVCDHALRTCPQCNMLFDSKKKMNQHRIANHPMYNLTCQCGVQCTSKEKLMEHYRTCHIDNTGCVYRCKECGEMFRDRLQMFRHARHHILKSDEKTCDICGHKYNGNDALTKHRQEEHGSIDSNLYRCKVCSYTSPNHNEVYIHVRNHLSKQEVTRHLCESCGRSFATRATLMRHSVQHTNIKHLTCRICSKQFADVKARNDHILGHEHVTVCEKCGQIVQSGKLDAHFCL